MKFLKLTILCLPYFFTACNSERSITCEEKISNDCFCTQQYDPVCGCNNKTYGNACEAGCAAMEVVAQGECKQTQILGKWIFLGYQKKDGIDVANPTKKHKYSEVYIEFLSKDANGVAKFSGKSSINFIGGDYSVNGPDLTLTSIISTKIGGSDVDLDFEQKFVDNLAKAKSNKIEDNILLINIIDAHGDSGQDEVMIFKK